MNIWDALEGLDEEKKKQILDAYHEEQKEDFIRERFNRLEDSLCRVQKDIDELKAKVFAVPKTTPSADALCSVIEASPW